MIGEEINIDKWDTVDKVVQFLSDMIISSDEVDYAIDMLDCNSADENDRLGASFNRMDFMRFIRNSFGLWKNNTKLARNCLDVDPATSTGTFRLWHQDQNTLQQSYDSLLCGEVHPDDASEVIAKQLLKELKKHKESKNVD